MIARPTEFHLPEVTSTNDYAKELLSTYDSVFVSAQNQTSGRGRNGKSWFGGYGSNVYCSVGINHRETPATEDLASYMPKAALSVIETLRHIAPSIEYRLKYPNDVFALYNRGWGKIAGSIVEHEYLGSNCVSTVIGIGVNINQESFDETIQQKCTSLFQCGIEVDVASFTLELKKRLYEALDLGWKDVLSTWKKELAIENKRIRIVDDSDSWIVSELMNDGRLLVRNQNTFKERMITDGDSLRYEH